MLRALAAPPIPKVLKALAAPTSVVAPFTPKVLRALAAPPIPKVPDITLPEPVTLSVAVFVVPTTVKLVHAVSKPLTPNVLRALAAPAIPKVD